MAQVLSLMATHSKNHLDDGSGSQDLRIKEKEGYTQVPVDQTTYTRGFTDQKAWMYIHALSCIEKCVQFGKLGFWSLVFGPVVLDHGISSEVLNLGIWTQVLVLIGFGPWY